MKETKSEIANALFREATRQDLPGFKNDKISFTVKEEIVAKYEPELWNDILKYASAPGNEGLVQRRLNNAYVRGLIDEGEPLPSGVDFEAIKKSHVRRTSS